MKKKTGYQRNKELMFKILSVVTNSFINKEAKNIRMAALQKEFPMVFKKCVGRVLKKMEKAQDA